MSAGSIAEVVDLIERFGTERYDEEVAQLDHALQTAALAAAEHADDALIAAALLHDIGHLLDLRDGGGPAVADHRHEQRGAAWLRPLLPKSVTTPIALHVRAKRYLCTVDATYTSKLSPGSVRSLRHQGGPLNAAEVEAFEMIPHHQAAARLRRWDDAGKVDGLTVAPLATYLDLLEHLAATCQTGRLGSALGG